KPTTQTMNATHARQQFATVLNRVFRKEARVVIEKSGIPVAAIVSAEDLKRLDRLDEQEREVWETLAAMRAPFKDVPVDEIERATERIIAENRRERYQQQREGSTGR